MAVKFKDRVKTDYIVVHCSATPPDRDIGVKDIERWHRGQGYIAVGYHFVIKRDGVIEEGRPESVVGAHAKGVNESSIGICLVGGVDKGMKPEDNFTNDQMNSLATLIDMLQTRYKDAEVIGHRDVPNTNKACPSFDAKGWWASQ